MRATDLRERLECFPIIAAIRDDRWQKALHSPAEVLFYLEANLLTVKQHIQQAHDAGKVIFVHLDLAEGIGKDRSGIEYLAKCGVDGIISTRAQIIRLAKDTGLLTVQRFFTLDSKGMDSIDEMLRSTEPHMMELMPGIICKTVQRFSQGHIPVIAGGLVQTKQEVMDALNSGAAAVSTGQTELWYL